MLIDSDAALSPMPVIVGAPRSGTTLLRFMLDAHPLLAIPPETGFLAADPALLGQLGPRDFAGFVEQFPPGASGWQDHCIDSAHWRQALARLEPFRPAGAFRCFYRLYAARFGKPRWGDKTPGYVFHMTQIERMLPEAHFIHLIRDGRDLALSWRQTWFAPGPDMKTLASHLQASVRAGLRGRVEVAHCLEVRYEELIADPQSVLARVCAYIGIDVHPAMPRYHQHSAARLAEHAERRRSDGSLLVGHEERLGQQRLTTQPPDRSREQAWQGTLTAAERAQFAAEAGDLLAELGYEP